MTTQRSFYLGCFCLFLLHTNILGKHLGDLSKGKESKKSDKDNEVIDLTGDERTIKPIRKDTTAVDKKQSPQEATRRQFYGPPIDHQMIDYPEPFVVQHTVNRPYAQHRVSLVPRPYPVDFVQYVPQPYPVHVPVKPHVHVSHLHLHHRVHANPCLNGGIFVRAHHGHFCICPKEFRGDHCKDRNYCASDPCKNGATCVELNENYKCLCAREFMSYNCEDRNPCYPNPCKNEGQCTKSDEEGGFTCFCKDNFSGKKCTEINQCETNPCANDGTCLQRGDKVECICPPQFKGTTCENVDYCFHKPCLNGGVCYEDGNLYNCTCKQGFIGHNCEEHVCHPNPCYHGGHCSVEYGHFKCHCPRLFKGDHCEVPHPCATAPCLNGGVCLDSFSGYSGYPDNWNHGYLHYLCVCNDGFRGNHCEDNVCHHCDINAKCLNGTCLCNDGYQGNGFMCEKIPHPCHPNPCRNGGGCKNLGGGSYDCVCKVGFSGKNCLDKDPCKPNPCQHGGNCLVTADESSFTCVCNIGYTGPTCSKPDDPCKVNPCMNEGTCYNENGVAKCRCLGHWAQPYCKECGCPKATGKDHVDQLCDRIGECYCANNDATMSKLGCLVGGKDNCFPNPCLNNGKCTNIQPDSFSCACLYGFTGITCEKEICNPNPCRNGGECTALQSGHFQCKCKSGFSGTTCEKQTIIPVNPDGKNCVPNPCQNGGQCTGYGTGYDCTCGQRYTGPHCEVDKCEKCDIHAVCHNGVCHCINGYTGNGYKCLKSHKKHCSAVCPINSFCQNNACNCMTGYAMNHQGLCIDESVTLTPQPSYQPNGSWYYAKR